MTWTKKGCEFGDECARAGLSDAAYRVHDEAIGWLYTVEATDCRIPKHLVRRFAGSPDWEQAIKELVEVHRFWRDRGDCWEVVHHGDVIRQSIGAQRALKARNKVAQAAWRQRQKAAPGGPGVSAYESDDPNAYVTDLSDRQPTTRRRAPGEDPNPDGVPADSAALNGAQTVSQKD